MASIKNWDRFQHFKDRSPPWIKLYRDLLDDLQWHKLDPVAAKALVMLWLIASENDGHLPDTEELAFRLRMSESDLLEILPKLSHWIDGDCIAAISPRYHDDDKPISLTRSQETETEEETEREAEGETEAAQARPATPPPKKRAKAEEVPKPDDVADEVWDAFREVRKAKRAPLTRLALDELRREADKAGWTLERALRQCCKRGWQGFEASWLREDKAQQPRASPPAGRYANTIAGLTGGNRQPEPEYIDVVATERPAAARLG